MGIGWEKRAGGDVKDRILSMEIKQQIMTVTKDGLQALDSQFCPPPPEGKKLDKTRKDFR